MHRFNFLECGNTILLYWQIYRLDFIEPCILLFFKYLPRAQRRADLLLDEALRPMKEGLGSYVSLRSPGSAHTAAR